MKTVPGCVLLVSSWLMVSCDRASSPTSSHRAPPTDDVLASVQGRPIRVADFEAEWARRVRPNADPLARPGAKEGVLEDLVAFESLYFRAQEAGFDRRPEIARQIRRFIVDRFTEEQLTSDPAPATEAEIADYYERHAVRFATPEQVRFAVIQLGISPKAVPEKKAEVLRKAASILGEARALPASEPGFGPLARRYSENQATRYTGGEAGWLSRGDTSRWNRIVVDAVFALEKPGDLSPVVETADGCCLLKLIERKPAGRRELAEVREAIGYQLGLEKRQRRQQEFYQRMKAGLKIEINRALLESLRNPAIQTESKPPSSPAG